MATLKMLVKVKRFACECRNTRREHASMARTGTKAAAVLVNLVPLRLEMAAFFGIACCFCKERQADAMQVECTCTFLYRDLLTCRGATITRCSTFPSSGSTWLSNWLHALPIDQPCTDISSPQYTFSHAWLLSLLRLPSTIFCSACYNCCSTPLHRRIGLLAIISNAYALARAELSLYPIREWIEQTRSTLAKDHAVE